jgi:transcriptional regulator with XRE-family HTH domain
MNLVQQQDFYQRLGIIVREARLKIGLSQEVLGDQLSLTKASIANIEKGRQRPMAHTLIELAQALRISLAELIPDMESTLPGPTLLVASSAENISIVSDNEQVDKGVQDAVRKFVSDIFINKEQ